MAELPSTPLKTVPLGFMSVDPIYGDDDSFEVETPDFHFDWLATTNDRQGARLGDGTSTPNVGSSTPAWTKPAPLSHKVVVGVVSQGSSPSWSATSTPPSDQPTSNRPTVPSSLSVFSEASETRQPLPSKPHPRVVSAPLPSSSSADDVEAIAVRAEYCDLLTFQSTRRDEGGVPLGEHRATSRSAYATPGLTQRTLASASSARRVAKPNPNLSRFGGPARRVAPPPDVNESEEGSSAGNAQDAGGTPQGQSLSTHAQDVGTPQPRVEMPRGHLPSDSPPIVYQKQRVGHQHLTSPPPPPLTTCLGDNLPPRSRPPEDRGKYQGRSGERTHLRREDQSSPVLDEQRNRHEYQESSPSEAAQHNSIGEAPPPNRQHPVHDAKAAPEVHRLQAERSAPPTRAEATGAASVSHHVTETAHNKPTVASQTKRIFMVNGVPYERLGVLGRGGSSKVYSVLCPTKRVVYALKRVALERADAETYQSYTNEIELLRRLRGHDRIIQLIDHQITFNQGNRPKMLMMVMECGEIDFAALLDEQRGKPLNMSFVGLYWQQMLEAVQAVHAENVVHTDLKPANFVLVKGRLKIIDFGIAKAIANDTVNIQRDQQVGTVNYMSPEAIQKMNNQKVLKLSYPSDVWSLGCILYQMIYGNPPFHHISGGPLSKMNKIADPTHRVEFPSTAFPRPTGVVSQTTSVEVTVPNEAISTMRGCLEYHKDRRLTIPQLLDHDFLSSAPNSALPPGATWISKEQMTVLVAHVFKSKEAHTSPDEVAEDLFEQLAAQNALSSS